MCATQPCAAIAALLFFVARTTVGGEVFFEPLGYLPHGHAFPWSEARGVSADGKYVAGFSRSDNAGENGFEAFRWSRAEGLVPLGFIPSDPIRSSLANGVSADGRVVVGQGVGPLGLEAFRWVDGEMDGLGDLPGGEFLSYAKAASGDGSVVIGQGAHATGYPVWRWEGGVMESIGSLPGATFDLGNPGAITPDGMTIVGGANSGDGFEAFRWHDGVMEVIGDLPGGSVNGIAFAVTPDGAVLAGRGSIAGGDEAWLWQNGVMTPLGDLPGGAHFSEARAISADGRVIVGRSDSAAGEAAFIWDGRSGLRNLNQVFRDDYGFDLAGMHLLKAEGISFDGTTIVGTGMNTAGDAEAWVARIPAQSPPLRAPAPQASGRGW